MRDKAWLKEKVQTMIDEECRCYDPLIQQRKDTCRVIMDLIEQIDEPEKLSEEWINEHSKSYTMENAVEISDLKNLLLPQPQKPVVPQFVADYIETYKGRVFSLQTWLNLVNGDDEFESKTAEWLYGDSQEEMLKREYLLIDAIRYGYEVEKEKLYTVDLPPFYELIKRLDRNTYELKRYSDSGLGDYTNAFTEQEIKDYDKRFWAFAEEVTD